MASCILPLALSGSRKADGTVNAGGLVFLSLSGSPNSSVTGYLDRDKNAAATLDGGGYRLNQAGKIALFVDTTCKVIVQDTNGVNVDSFVYEVATNAGLVEILNPGFTGVSPTSGALVGGGRSTLDTVLSSLYSSLGGLDGKFRGVYGTADTNYKAEIEQIMLTPQRFGAKGDGVSDDTTALQAMANAQAASGIPVFIPRGLYKTTATIFFTSAARVFGASKNGSVGAALTAGGSVILCSAGAQGGFSFGAAAVVDSLTVVANAAACTVGMVFNFGTTGGIAPRVSNCSVITLSGGTWATCIQSIIAFALTGTPTATSMVLLGTNATLGDWIIDGGSSVTGVISATTFFGSTAASRTFDMANAGSTTPVVASPGVAYNRIRGTTAGAGTVNLPVAPTVGPSFLTLDCFNNSGGAYTFNLAATYHLVGAVTALAPANGLRIVVQLAWNSTESIWVEQSRTAAFT